MRKPPPTDATLAEALALHRGGRKPTGAHPLCVCRKPVDYPPRPEPIDWDTYSMCQTSDERRAFMASDRVRYLREMTAWRETCNQLRLLAHCLVHDSARSVWSMPR